MQQWDFQSCWATHLLHLPYLTQPRYNGARAERSRALILYQGLVNTIRLKEGVRYLLLYSLTGKEVDRCPVASLFLSILPLTLRTNSFQQEVKFLFRDTVPRM